MTFRCWCAQAGGHLIGPVPHRSVGSADILSLEGLEGSDKVRLQVIIREAEDDGMDEDSHEASLTAHEEAAGERGDGEQNTGREDDEQYTEEKKGIHCIYNTSEL